MRPMSVSPDQFVRVYITPGELAFIRRMAQAAELGGRSHIRASEDRQAALAEDQLIGQLGTAAFHKLWYGDLGQYKRERFLQNRFRFQGDGGSDLGAANIDVKTSLLRTGKPLLEHRLAVRPAERHPNWLYVLALSEPPGQAGAYVWLIGWATDAMLPHEPVQDGVFAGAYVLPGSELCPMPPVRWEWQVEKGA